MPDETEFRPIPGYPRNRVSADGRVQSNASGSWRDLKPIPHCQGYLVVSLSGPAGKSPHLIHRIVLAAWVGPCPEGHEALHGNDVKTDNRLVNLRWGTRTENNADAVRNGRRAAMGERYPGARLTDEQVLAILDRLREGATQRAVALEFGTSQPNISGLVNGVSRNDVTGLPRRPYPSSRRTCVA